MHREWGWCNAGFWEDGVAEHREVGCGGDRGTMKTEERGGGWELKDHGGD